MPEEKHEITIRLDTARQVFDTDWNGRIIEDSDKVFGRMNCALEVDKEQRVAFGIRSSLPKTRIKDNEERHIEDRLNFLTWKVIGIYLANCSKIDLFNIHHISLENYLEKRLPKNPEKSSEYFSPFACEICNEAFDNLKKQYGHYSAACKSFNHAVEQLREFAGYDPYGVKYHQSEIFSLLSFIERSLSSADVGYLYSWYKEKQSGIRGYFNDMLRRKQGSHPGYKQAQDYITRNLYSYHTPVVWLKKPPILKEFSS